MTAVPCSSLTGQATHDIPDCHASRATQLKGVTVEGNRDGLWVQGAGVAKLEGCTVRGNSDYDYCCKTSDGSRIEGVDQSLVTTR